MAWIRRQSSQDGEGREARYMPENRGVGAGGEGMGRHKNEGGEWREEVLTESSF
jgi:hypothetical protein